MADFEINQLDAGTLTPDSFLMADVPSGNSYTSGKINAQQFAGIATKRLTAAQYALLSSAEKNNGTQYVINDEEGETNIADAFDETASYNAGDWCIHDNTLYCFNASKSAGVWDSTKADAKTLDDLLNINSLSSGTVAAGDKLMFTDIDDANKPKATTAAAVAGLATTLETITHTITKTSGVWSVDTSTMKKSGHVVSIHMRFKGSGSVAGGANAFQGTLNTKLPILENASACGYFGGYIMVVVINPDGNIYVRNVNGTAVDLGTGDFNVCVTYLTA